MATPAAASAPDHVDVLIDKLANWEFAAENLERLADDR